MEPRRIKQMSEVLLAVGILLAVIGAVLMFYIEGDTFGIWMLLAGSVMALISLPTFMLLSMYSMSKMIE